LPALWSLSDDIKKLAGTRHFGTENEDGIKINFLRVVTDFLKKMEFLKVEEKEMINEVYGQYQKAGVLKDKIEDIWIDRNRSKNVDINRWRKSEDEKDMKKLNKIGKSGTKTNWQNKAKQAKGNKEDMILSNKNKIFKEFDHHFQSVIANIPKRSNNVSNIVNFKDNKLMGILKKDHLLDRIFRGQIIINTMDQDEIVNIGQALEKKKSSEVKQVKIRLTQRKYSLMAIHTTASTCSTKRESEASNSTSV
jgi:hypothetical protein